LRRGFGYALSCELHPAISARQLRGLIGIRTIGATAGVCDEGRAIMLNPLAGLPNLEFSN
jgi:hypothetical protein